MTARTETTREARARRVLARRGLALRKMRSDRWTRGPGRYGIIDAERNLWIVEPGLDLDGVEEWLS